MNIQLLVVGKTNQNYLSQGVDEYTQRLKHYVHFELVVISDVKNPKNLSTAQLKDMEADNILKHISTEDMVVLFDERGKEFRSMDFAQWLQKCMLSGTKNLIFVVGGAFGFSQKIYDRANSKVSLSQMTFSHQMIRLLATEQIYRAFTILAHEPYHNE